MSLEDQDEADQQLRQNLCSVVVVVNWFLNFRFQEHLLLTDQTNLFQRKAISDAAQSQDQDSRKLIVQAASQNNKQLVTKRLLALALQNNEE